MRDVRFELPVQDQVAATRAIFFRQRRTWMALAVFVALLAWLAWTDYRTLSRGYRVHWELTAVGVGIVAVGLLFLFFSPHLAVRSFRKNNRLILGEHSYRFLPDRLSMASPLASSDVAWAGFHAIREDTRFFFFYTTPRYAAVLPKRVLTTEELAELRAFLKDRCGDRAHV